MTWEEKKKKWKVKKTHLGQYDFKTEVKLTDNTTLQSREKCSTMKFMRERMYSIHSMYIQIMPQI